MVNEDCDSPEDSDDDTWDAILPLDQERLVDAAARSVSLTLAGRTYAVTQDFEARRRPLAGAPGTSEALVTTGAVLWDGSVVLAGVIATDPTRWNCGPGRRVLELGAGFNALSGTVAAAHVGVSPPPLTQTSTHAHVATCLLLHALGTLPAYLGAVHC